MKVQAITFTGRIKSGDVLNKLKKLDTKANRAVRKLEIKSQISSRNIENKILEKPYNPTPLDEAKILTTGTTSAAPIGGGLTTITYQPSWDASTII